MDDVHTWCRLAANVHDLVTRAFLELLLPDVWLHGDQNDLPVAEPALGNPFSHGNVLEPVVGTALQLRA